MRCPDCGRRMVKTNKGYECRNPACPVIRVMPGAWQRGYKGTRVTREARVKELLS